MAESFSAYYTNKAEQYKEKILTRVILNHIEEKDDPFRIPAYYIEGHRGKYSKAGRYLKQLGFVAHHVYVDRVEKKLVYGCYSNYLQDIVVEDHFYLVDQDWFNGLKSNYRDDIEFRILDVDNKDRAKYTSPLHRSYRPFDVMSVDELCSYHFYPERFDVIDKPIYQERWNAAGVHGTTKACFPKKQISTSMWDAIIKEVYSELHNSKTALRECMVFYGDFTDDEIDSFLNGVENDNLKFYMKDDFKAFCTTIAEVTANCTSYLKLASKVTKVYSDNPVKGIAFKVVKSLLGGEFDFMTAAPVTHEFVDAAKSLGSDKLNRFKEDAPLLLTHENEFIKDFAQRILKGE